MSLILLIVCVAATGCTLLIGTMLTLRRVRGVPQDPFSIASDPYYADVRACSYCDTLTDRFIGVTHNGVTYDPVCSDCQYRTGICNADGTINKEFYYQVEPAARF